MGKENSDVQRIEQLAAEIKEKLDEIKTRVDTAFKLGIIVVGAVAITCVVGLGLALESVKQEILQLNPKNTTELLNTVKEQEQQVNTLKLKDFNTPFSNENSNSNLPEHGNRER